MAAFGFLGNKLVVWAIIIFILFISGLINTVVSNPALLVLLVGAFVVSVVFGK